METNASRVPPTLASDLRAANGRVVEERARIVIGADGQYSR
jgi:hypothetical protein